MSSTKKPFVKPTITFIPAGSERYEKMLEAIRKEDPELYHAMQQQK